MARGTPRTPDMLSDFGLRVRDAIKDSRFRSRAEFLRAVKIPHATMNNYELGTRKPPLEVVLKIAEALGRSPVDFMPESELVKYAVAATRRVLSLADGARRSWLDLDVLRRFADGVPSLRDSQDLTLNVKALAIKALAITVLGEVEEVGDVIRDARAIYDEPDDAVAIEKANLLALRLRRAFSDEELKADGK